MRALFFFILALASSMTSANPGVFGLKIWETPVEQLQAQYDVYQPRVNTFSLGQMYELSTSQIDLEGLQAVTVIFSSGGGTLAGVLTTFPKSKFEYLNNTLGKKYQKLNEQIPFVGDKSATYRDGQTDIALEAPHLSFKMSLNYIHDDLNRAFAQRSQAEKREQQQRESSQL